MDNFLIIHIVHGGFWGGFFYSLDEKLCHNLFQYQMDGISPNGGDICARMHVDLDINGFIYDAFTMVNMIHDESTHGMEGLKHDYVE